MNEDILENMPKYPLPVNRPPRIQGKKPKKLEYASGKPQGPKAFPGPAASSSQGGYKSAVQPAYMPKGKRGASSERYDYQDEGYYSGDQGRDDRRQMPSQSRDPRAAPMQIGYQEEGHWPGEQYRDDRRPMSSQSRAPRAAPVRPASKQSHASQKPSRRPPPDDTNFADDQADDPGYVSGEADSNDACSQDSAPEDETGPFQQENQ